MSAENDKKQQFNVYLPPELVREVKHASVDAGQSLSKFVEDALRAHVDKVKQDQPKDNTP
jgi:predicted HicB family RNase H-like nuclease